MSTLKFLKLIICFAIARSGNPAFQTDTPGGLALCPYGGAGRRGQGAGREGEGGTWHTKRREKETEADSEQKY